jgi:phosphate starvation-inducible PhoH-like protein
METYVKKLTPKSPNQKSYLRAIQRNKVVFCTGPAGTGKTALATRYGISQLLEQTTGKLVICRPLVQAGEDTGFLPGGIEDKLDPYVRPIFDELKLYVDCKQLKSMFENDMIEIVPFAYMRGRNFHNAYIIADEAQNATYEQLKMLLTRIGRQSRMIVNGDIQQSDLQSRDQGGLLKCASVLQTVKNIAWVQLEREDIVREPIVADIVAALD